MSKPNVPDNVLDKLRCSFCTEYLSVPPIQIYPDSQRPTVTCGRCPTLSDLKPIRNMPYESLAALLNYPCRYKNFGCLSILPIDAIHAHEESCSYRQYYCPQAPLGVCPWQGPSSELFTHFLDCHNIYVLKASKFEIDMVNKYEENYLFCYFEDIFVLQTRCNTNDGNLWMHVRYIGPKECSEKFSFKISIINPNNEDKIIFGPKTVGCDTVMTVDETAAINISIESLLVDLKDPAQIVCAVDIIRNDNIRDGEDNMDSISVTNSEVDEKLLRKLECPICSEYMSPPIHQCVTGHSICANCKPTCTICPLCKSEIGNTRNFTLEDLAEDFKYPCKYQQYDCSFTGGHSDVKKHEMDCAFGPYECPLNAYLICSWKGKISQVMEHVREEHEDYVLDYEDLSCIFNESEIGSDCRITAVQGRLFKIIYKYENQHFYWLVQLVGPAQDCAQYTFELDFINPFSNERIYFKRSCASLSNDNEPPSGSKYLKVPYYLINNFIVDNEFNYKCTIRHI